MRGLGKRACAGTQSCLQQIVSRLWSARHTSGVLSPHFGRPGQAARVAPALFPGGPVRWGPTLTLTASLPCERLPQGHPPGQALTAGSCAQAGAGHEGSGAAGSQGRAAGAAVLGGCAHPPPKHFRRMLPHRAGTQDAPPHHRRLQKGLSSQVVASLLGPRGIPARAGRTLGHRGAGGDPGWASTLQLPSVAICSHRDACRGRRDGKACPSGCSMQDSDTNTPCLFVRALPPLPGTPASADDP